MRIYTYIIVYMYVCMYRVGGRANQWAVWASRFPRRAAPKSPPAPPVPSV